MYTKDENEIGALWVKHGPKTQYLAGQIEIKGEKINIVCFVNNYRTKPNQPDYKVLIARPRTEKSPKLPTNEEAKVVLSEEIEAISHTIDINNLPF